MNNDMYEVIEPAEDVIFFFVVAFVASPIYKIMLLLGYVLGQQEEDRNLMGHEAKRPIFHHEGLDTVNR